MLVAVTIQPFREEIARVIAIYLADSSPRQLNLSSKERASLLHALTNTTHPSAFTRVIQTVEWSLRHQSHPNFIRWTICNGNRPRVVFARGLGVGGIISGIVAAILITLSHAGRGWRVLSAIGFLIGVATLICAWKGMCIVSFGGSLVPTVITTLEIVKRTIVTVIKIGSTRPTPSSSSTLGVICRRRRRIRQRRVKEAFIRHCWHE